ncbi:MAG: hypothetical protein HYV32_02900 [Candidatus Kerfeldbacteria bacterium]|nr:hypothetical protein [Candidatus Kerfeldbacteria bacterium]
MKKYIHEQFEREEALLRSVRMQIQQEPLADSIDRVEQRLRQSFWATRLSEPVPQPMRTRRLPVFAMPVVLILLLTIVSAVPTYLFINHENATGTEQIVSQNQQFVVLGSSGATTQSESAYSNAPENTTTKGSEKKHRTPSADLATLCGSTPGLLCDQNATAMALGTSSNPFHEILDNLGGWRGVGIISIFWFVGYSILVLVVMGIARIVRGLRSKKGKI